MYSDFEMNINLLLKSQSYGREKSKNSKINAGQSISSLHNTINVGKNVKPRCNSIYNKPNGNHSAALRSDVRKNGSLRMDARGDMALRHANKPYSARNSAGFAAYLFRGNNFRVIAVSVSVIVLLALCSFALNAGNDINTDTDPTSDGGGYTYSFADGEKFTAVNPAFALIAENVSFTITDGIRDSMTVSIPPATVGEAFAKLGIALNSEDIINCDMGDVVTDGINVIILRTDSKTHQVSEEIPFETQIIEVDAIKKGTTQVVRKGIAGLKVKYYEQSYTNDVLDEEVKTGEKVIREPVNEIVYKGVGGTFRAPNGETYNYSYVLTVEATAYGDISGGKNPKWTGITYTGTKARPGIIAVDPNVISLGSSVYVTGDYGDYGICAAEDTGSAVKGGAIDIFMESKEEMVKFGRRSMKAYILE